MFAAGTLGDRMFGLPKTSYRALMLDRVIEERHHNTRRDDTGSTHDEDDETCMLDSEEFSRRVEALRCNEEYMQAVREEIERSNCVNELYDPDTNGYDDESDVCVITDERDDVNTRCSYACADNQSGYLACKYLGEEVVQLYRDCGWSEAAEAVCIYNDRGYCFAETLTASNLPTIYDECFRENNMNASICSVESAKRLWNL